MKTLLLCVSFAVCLLVAAADQPSTNAPSAQSPAPAVGDDAAAAWDKITQDFQALRNAKSNDVETKKKTIIQIFAETKAFAAKYPDSAHATDAMLLWAQLGQVMDANHLDGAPPPSEIMQTYDRLATDPKTSQAQHAQVRALQISSAIQRAAQAPDDSAQWNGIEDRFDSFEKEFGVGYLVNDSQVYVVLRNMELTVLSSNRDHTQYNAVIKKLAASSDPHVAAIAKNSQAEVQPMDDVKSKPATGDLRE